MAISIDGTGTVTGISIGGLPDGIVDTDMLAANAVTEAKLGSDQQQGLAKAWVNFNGTGTVAIRDNFNVSSITDNGNGDYTVNFTNAMANANYAMVGTGSLDGRTETIVVTGYTEATRLAASIRINTRYDNSIVTNGTNVDMSTVAIAIFGG
jgi:hypothetical protein